MWKLALLKTLATIAVVLVGLSAGLGARGADLVWLWRRPALLGRSLFVSVLVMPAVVVPLLLIIPLPSQTRACLLTMAIVPAAPMAIGKAAKEGGHHSYAISLEVTLILLMVVTLPLLQIGVGALINRDLSLGALQATMRAVLSQVLPLGLGLLIAARWPLRASRLGQVTAKIGIATLMALALLILVVSAHALVALGAASYAVMALVASLVVLAAHTLGGPAADTRHTLAVFSVLRHPGLAVLLVTLNAPKLKVAPAVLAYLIVASVVLAVYHRFAGATSGARQPHVFRHAPQR